MEPKELARFKKMFEKQKRELLGSQAIVDVDLKLEKDDMLDEVDMTSCELETAMKMRLRNRETLFLKKIDEALKRIVEGRFGDCNRCEEAIEIRRLEARPTATLCVNCKEEQERLEHAHIDSHRPKSLGSRLRLA